MRLGPGNAGQNSSSRGAKAGFSKRDRQGIAACLGSKRIKTIDRIQVHGGGSRAASSSGPRRPLRAAQGQVYWMAGHARS